MPQVRALKSFQGKHGYIRAGQLVNLEDGYVRDLLKNKLVETLEGDGGPKQQGRQAARAPYAAAGLRQPATRPGTEPPLGDGTTLSPLSSRAGQARAKKTQKLAGAGGKKVKTDE